jgi:hypothetical protein
MAVTTIGVFLMIEEAGAFEKLIDITSYPDLGSSPEQIDITTMSNLEMRTYTKGLQDLPSFDFGAIYTPSGYTRAKSFEGGVEKFSLWFGADATGVPDGHDGKRYWDGELSVYIAGGAINEAATMTLNVVPNTEISETPIP